MPGLIEDYAIIGDCETAALVSRMGSIDWLCWPRFDSSACFAALLGSEKNGHWSLAPADPTSRCTRRYRDNSLILETDYETADGAVTVIDFMPLRDGVSNVVRTVIGKRGRVPMRTEIVLRFDYGSVVPWVSRLDDGTLRAIAGPDMICIRSDVQLRGQDLTTIGEFTIAEGDRASMVMTWGPSNQQPPAPSDPDRALEVTEDFWRRWSSLCHYDGEWSGAVMRSLVTLKSLTYHPTGGIVAAPTTSLPEQLAGSRNWDYRFCWLRDATLTLLALMNAGYYHEAGAWREWLLRACAGAPDQVQIMYGLSGERMLREWEISWLPGYENAKPVRCGNAAHEQIQHDIFGEVMDALHQARVGGMPELPDAWQLECALLQQLEQTWRKPDHSIWEVRGTPQHFTHSKVMAWVAFDRAIKSAERFNLKGPLDRWRRIRQDIHDEVCEKAYDPNLNAFTQSYDSKLADASTLALATVGFLPPSDPRVRGTVEYVEKKLCAHGFVLRYDSEETDDGLPPGEGAFLACSFWLADNYVLLGRRGDAVKLFERLLSLRNDVGLLSEEYDPIAKRLVGNFPQGFSHIALLSTAFNLSKHQGASSKDEPISRI
ncbi:MAG TPA: glycoside hydrolase family 15 protein [Gemmatimonadaceae bacterium]|nr:glycoside hydrolase family 15 protein [Gemmatimonadaceae bacterium]